MKACISATKIRPSPSKAMATGLLDNGITDDQFQAIARW